MWDLESDCLDLNPGSSTFLLHDLRQVIQPLGASVFLYAEWEWK